VQFNWIKNHDLNIMEFMNIQIEISAINDKIVVYDEGKQFLY